MPIYEYECAKCATRFDAMLTLSGRDEAERELACPECGATGPRRLISTFAPGASSAASTPPPCGDPGACPGGG